MINQDFSVRKIKKEESYQWVLKKHYSHRLPPISYSFGLYDHSTSIVGVCTFGMPPNYIEMKSWEPFPLVELNRLVVEDGLPRNTLSFFVSHCLKMLPQNTVVISYSDLRAGHHGYIYQATNWLYTGIGGEGQSIYVMKDGSERHQRHEDTINMNHVDHIEKTIGKNRYYFFAGGKEFKKRMKEKLRFKILPYPKGNNTRYDTSATVEKQGLLF